GTVNSSLTRRPSAEGWINRRWWGSDGVRPHTRHGCLETNFRCSLSRRRTVLANGETASLRGVLPDSVKIFWLADASARPPGITLWTGPALDWLRLTPSFTVPPLPS